MSEKILQMQRESFEALANLFEKMDSGQFMGADDFACARLASDLHQACTSQLAAAKINPTGCVEKADLLNAIALLERYMGPHEHAFDTVREVRDRLREYAGPKGGDA